ncbi:MAG TPA: hypothetical protein VL282_06675 [Tepidisphaeraceae bacterium]|jgi:hypothetical protein|nr:hypothetical protein [Tepidisphaeraceae bacterium]
MTAHHRHELASIESLDARLSDFDQAVANIFSGHDSIADTPWVARTPSMRAVARDAMKQWCKTQWPVVRDSALKHIEEAKRRMLS